jgi:hypothetical protein
MFFGGLAFSICLSALPLSAAQRQLVSNPASVQQGTEQNPQGAPPAGQASVAPTLILPVGTLVTVRTTQLLSSDLNQPGDSFTTVLEQPLVVQGWVVSRRGQIVVGQIAVAKKAGRVQGVSQLAIELNEVSIVDGQQLAIQTQLMQSSVGPSHEEDAAQIGAATETGAIIGGAAGGGKGAAIGAAVGAAAGVVGVLSTRGRPTEIPAETVLTFRLDSPLTVDTQQSPQAFQPVTAEDYSNHGVVRNPSRYPGRGGYGPPGPYYYPTYPYGGYYGIGIGPRIFVSPGIYVGRGSYGRR